MRVRLTLALALGLCVVSVSALRAKSGAATSQPKLTPLTLALNWIPSAEFAGTLIAIDKGWYREAGIDLKPIFIPLKADDAVMENKADIGLCSGVELVREVGKGAPLKAFAAHYQFSPQTLTTGQASGIKSLKDLKGKTLAIFQNEDFDVYRVILADVGLKLSDVKFHEVSTTDEKSVVELLKQKKIDALLAWEFHWPILFSLRGYPMRQFPSYKNGFHFYGLVFMGKKAFLNANHDLLAKFLAVTQRGWKEVYSDPERYAQEVVDRWYPEERRVQHSRSLMIKEQLLELKLSQRFLYEGISQERYGQMSRFLWTRSLAVAREFKIIEGHADLTPEDFYDTTILPLLKKVAR